MTKVECPLDTCKHVKKGICQKESIYLKWRMAGDFGKGNIVMVECYDLELIPREFKKPK